MTLSVSSVCGKSENGGLRALEERGESDPWHNLLSEAFWALFLIKCCFTRTLVSAPLSTLAEF